MATPSSHHRARAFIAPETTAAQMAWLIPVGACSAVVICPASLSGVEALSPDSPISTGCDTRRCTRGSSGERSVEFGVVGVGMDVEEIDCIATEEAGPGVETSKRSSRRTLARVSCPDKRGSFFHKSGCRGLGWACGRDSLPRRSPGGDVLPALPTFHHLLHPRQPRGLGK